MKTILIISDSHGLLLPDVMAHVAVVDEVWHSGDWGSMEVLEQLEKSGKAIQGVYGNIDGGKLRTALKDDAYFECEGMKIFMTHIGGYPGKYARGIKEKLKQTRPNIFICGHSHILKVIYDKELSVLHCNPGACGVHGFHVLRTLLRIKIDAGKVVGAEIIELGKRA
jgi:putative phosphoesterase